MHLISLDDNMKALAVPIINVKVEKPELFMVSLSKKMPDVVLQAVNAKYVADLDHLWAIIRQVWVANKKGISKVKFDLDIILRLSCTTYLDNALKIVGLKPGLQDLIFIAIGKEEYFHEVYSIVSSLGDISDDLLKKSFEKDEFLIKYHKINNLSMQSLLLEKNQLSAILAEKAAVISSR